MADQRRAAGRLPDQGDARGQAADLVDRAGRAVRGGGARPWPPRRSTTRSCRGPSRASSPGSRATRRSTRSAPSSSSSPCPGCPTSTRDARWPRCPWSTRITGGRWTSPALRSDLTELDTSLDAIRRGGLPTGTLTASPGRSCWSPPGRCGCGAPGRSGSPATTSRWPRPAPRPGTRSPSGAAGRRSRSSPGCPSACAAAAAGRTRRCRCRRLRRGSLGRPADRRRAPRRGGADDRTDGPAARRAACSGGRMTAFSVWAPEAGRVDVEVAGQAVPDVRAGRAARAGGRRRRTPRPGPTTRSASTAASRSPTRARRASPYGPGGASRTYDHAAFAWTDDRWRGAPVGGAVIYELHVGTFTAGGDAGRRHRAARLPGVARRHRRGADAGRRLPRRARLGIRRDRPVGRARALRRARRAEAVRRRLPRPRARRLPRRRLQPRRPGQPARLVRAVLHRRLRDPVGPGGQPGPARVGRGALVHRRQRADVAARLPPRRAAARRGARVPGPPRGAPPRGARGRGGRARRRHRTVARARRRVRHEQPPADHPARGRRLRPVRAVG